MIIDHELLTSDGINKFHVLLTTPTSALIEAEHLRKFKWRLLCIDNAHEIKERDGKKNPLLSAFTTDAKLLLTSTPL